jgi:branched-chain amino acid transport system ATP-binding protein
MALLELTDVEARYGPIKALHGVSLRVDEGQAVSLLGANGAGKTTTLRAISGLLPVRRGTIEFEGERIDGLRSSQVVRRGVAHVPEGRQLFPTMTVRENLELGAAARGGGGRAAALDGVFALFPRLRERERQLAGTLSGGEQQMCAIGRGLMAGPRLLLLDEPSLGLSPVMVRLIFANLAQINGLGTTMLLVEQNVARALQLSHRGYVIENGRIVLDGTREILQGSGHIKQAYLGL